MIKKVATGKFAGKYMVRVHRRINGTLTASARIYANTLAEARKVEDDLNHDFDRGYTKFDASSLISEYFWKWFQDMIEPTLEVNSKQDYFNLRRRLEKELPETKMIDWDGQKQLAQRFFNILGKIYTTGTNSKYRSMLQRMFSDAEYNGVIRKTPFPYENRIKITGTDSRLKKAVPALSRNDANLLRNYLYSVPNEPKYQEYLALLIMLETGARVNEAKSLEFRYIDVERKQIHIQNNYVNKTDELKRYPKNGMDRYVPISTELAERLTVFMRIKKMDINNSHISRATNLIFRKLGDKQSSRILSTPQMTQKALFLALKKSGVPECNWTTRDGQKITPKALRATHDTILIAAGVPIEYIAQISGHTIEIINKYYRALLDEQAQKGQEMVRNLW
ncbi:phage integrase [Weissella oryzae SG25]|uniref:Phage integrase n=1 Tax=Weissella oryzae (strain DSM 25784 / JCM 18191 / LMG 30913 / SG25) TaxID=1329250 RepID=A0A069CSP7_WEIOS|nr:site-specific integrase [Weissella oryzae]GAK30253.1 phage integrase [Weissella oryzae SG25]